MKKAVLLSIIIFSCFSVFSQDKENTTPQPVQSPRLEQFISQPNQTQSKESSDFWLWVAIAAEGIFSIGITILFLIRYSEEKIKNIFFNSKRFQEHPHYDMNDSINRLRTEVNGLRTEINKINQIKTNHSNRFSTERQPSTTERESKTPVPHQPAPKPPVIKYPNAIILNGFRDDLSDVQGENYFKFFEIQGENACYDFCGNNIERAKANKTEIEQVCEISGSSFEAQAIENVENGSVIRKNGMWEVTKKAKIKFV